MLTLYAASRNKIPIFDALSPIIRELGASKSGPILALEIAAGTGEHAAYFTQQIPSLQWLPTEFDEKMIDSLKAYAEYTDYATGSRIVSPPIQLNLLQAIDEGIFPQPYRPDTIDFIFCCNMIHISPIETTSALFRLAARYLRADGVVATYGPYRVGRMVESNEEFDRSLKARNPLWGIRDLEYVADEAKACGLELEKKIEMPSNNLSLVFRKKA
jgi:hypothetical protein